jgi:hypothetical protein
MVLLKILTRHKLTLIRSLDTLDISHNKIRRLPNEPGSLVNLRVRLFSLFSKELMFQL